MDTSNNHTEAYEAIMNEMSSLFVKVPTTSFYEVNSAIHLEQLAESLLK